MSGYSYSVRVCVGSLQGLACQFDTEVKTAHQFLWCVLHHWQLSQSNKNVELATDTVGEGGHSDWLFSLANQCTQTERMKVTNQEGRHRIFCRVNISRNICVMNRLDQLRFPRLNGKYRLLPLAGLANSFVSHRLCASWLLAVVVAVGSSVTLGQAQAS